MGMDIGGPAAVCEMLLGMLRVFEKEGASTISGCSGSDDGIGPIKKLLSSPEDGRIVHSLLDRLCPAAATITPNMDNDDEFDNANSNDLYGRISSMQTLSLL